MPSAPPRVCGRCKQPAPAGKPCPCRPAWSGSTRGGSTRRWRKVRVQQLRAHPRCQHPGCIRLADEVDHVIPLAEGGDEFDLENLASLCRNHHKAKTAADALRGRQRHR